MKICCKENNCRNAEKCVCRVIRDSNLPIIWIFGHTASGKSTHRLGVLSQFCFVYLVVANIIAEYEQSADPLPDEDRDHKTIYLLEAKMKHYLSVARGFFIQGYAIKFNSHKCKSLHSNRLETVSLCEEFEKYIAPCHMILYFYCNEDLYMHRMRERYEPLPLIPSEPSRHSHSSSKHSRRSSRKSLVKKKSSQAAKKKSKSSLKSRASSILSIVSSVSSMVVTKIKSGMKRRKSSLKSKSRTSRGSVRSSISKSSRVSQVVMKKSKSKTKSKKSVTKIVAGRSSQDRETQWRTEYIDYISNFGAIEDRYMSRVKRLPTNFAIDYTEMYLKFFVRSVILGKRLPTEPKLLNS